MAVSTDVLLEEIRKVGDHLGEQIHAVDLKVTRLEVGQANAVAQATACKQDCASHRSAPETGILPRLRKLEKEGSPFAWYDVIKVSLALLAAFIGVILVLYRLGVFHVRT